MDLYTSLPNRLGLHLIEFDQFNHVDFLYSRNVSDMVYNRVINTLITADFVDWKPVYDNITSSNGISNYIQCNDINLKGEKIPRKNTDSLWNKITSYIKKKEIRPIVQPHEENIQTQNTHLKSWKETFHL